MTLMTSHSRLNQIQIDTREKKNSFIEKQLKDKDIPFFRSKMYVGDYKFHINPYYVIDRKANMSEIYQNITNGYSTFIKELKKAQSGNIQLVFLIEEETIKNLDDVKEWQHPHPEYHIRVMPGKAVFHKLEKIAKEYGCLFLFATHDEYVDTMLNLLESARDTWLQGIATVYRGSP